MQYRRKLRARGVVLWGFTGFFALQLGLGAAIECGLWGFRDPYYQHMIVQLRRQWRQRTHGDSHAPTKLAVMLGSSRTGNGLKGSCFEEEIYAALGERWVCSNLVAPAAGPVIELISLRRLLAEGIRPDFVLVEVTPLFLSEPLREAGSIKPERLSFPDLDCMDQCGMPHSGELRRAWWSDWASPWYAHRFSILSETAPMFVPFSLQQGWTGRCDRTGWVELEPDPSATAAQYQAINKAMFDMFEPPLRDFRPAEPSRKALRAILEECRRHDIPAALVLFAESTTVRSMYSPAARAGVNAVTAELQAEFGVPLIDARSWVPDEQFVDHVHVFRAGAEIYTRRLAHELAPMLRRGDQPQANRSGRSEATPGGNVPAITTGRTQPGSR